MSEQDPRPEPASPDPASSDPASPDPVSPDPVSPGTASPAARAAGAGGGRGIAVVTDSSSSLPADPATGLMADASGESRVLVLPLPVDIADRSYQELGPELDRELTLALAQGTAVRTSRPSPGRVSRGFEQLIAAGFDGIVAVHLSAKLSGTVDAAQLAASAAGVPVAVVDSRQTGYCLGHAVLDAAHAAAEGGTLDEVAAAARTAASQGESLFVVPHLEQLRRGGRINTAASIIGNLLSVKPLLGISEGEVTVLERPHSLPRAVDRLVHRAQAAIAGERASRVVVHSCGNPQQGRELADRLGTGLDVPVQVVELPPVLAAHLGLGALGICISRPAAR